MTTPNPNAKKTPQWTCKPNSVRRRPALRPGYGEMTIPLGPASLTGSSDLPGSVDRTGRPNGRSHALPYLVLLHAGFGLPRLLPAARCALTAPFHPYLQLATRRYVFCATFRRVAPPGCYPAHCPVEFGLSSPRGTSRVSAVAPRGDHPVRCGVSALLSIRRSPAKWCTAPASCRGCFAACRSLRRSSRCSRRSRAAWPPDRRAPTRP